MVKLKLEDRKRLVDLLANQKILQDTRGRATIFRYAGLESLLPQIDLEGPTIVVVSEIIQLLETYGRVSYEHESLGRFLSALSDYVGIESQDFLGSLLVRYSLMIPGARSPLSVEWNPHETGDDIVEAIIGENTLRPIAFFRKGIEASRAVALVLIQMPDSQWAGTGFLVGPNLLMTNHHVLPNSAMLDSTMFRFNYELDFSGNPRAYVEYKAHPEGCFVTNQHLDYTIVQLEDVPGEEWGAVELSLKPILRDARVNIIQHPAAMPKQVSFRNNFVKYVNSRVVQYVTTTMPGSSGSPVFSEDWRVMAIHHAGGNLVEPATGQWYFRNEGTRISAIMSDLPEEIKRMLSIAGV